jgi:hypothetical protein
MSKKGKGFYEMDELEFHREWDASTKELHQSVLSDAGRENVVQVTCSILTDVDGTKKLVTYQPEYGDNEGTSYMRDFVRSCRRQKLLKEGQHLDVIVRTLPAHIFVHGIPD